ncbi:MAG: glycosyltransferase [Flavobacteriaceae bacterium]|nr:glycosyltransferase [Flavobacteriaceae bacterium]
MPKKKAILVAPLNWGLGHATRCIPIINGLLQNDFKVLIASDGVALQLLRKEFPDLKTVELPSYNINYPKNGSFLKWKLLLKLPQIKKAISSEKKLIKQLVSEGKIQGIISDNRFGVRSSKIPSVYITHQLNVLSGNSTFISSKTHQKIIKKFDECWVPDVEEAPNLSGKLGHLKSTDLNLKYMGILSRMNKIELPIKYKYLLLLSGPEPQRSMLEEELLEEFKNYNHAILLVRGVVETEQKINQKENLTIYNFMKTAELEKAINESEIIIARSGYTTLMDLSTLEKKVFFIPTPGQPEQFYLATRMKKLNMAPYCKQKDFTIDKLKEIENYLGLFTEENTNNILELFGLFEGK